ncbi:Nif3-like dinuclear metal center hexameric protein [Hydrogenophilus thermoluteolus]|uniref:Metal-binding protein n=1 Tax=Hydrogenophilus thermoluteolus TaxID=297 RepID=A0A2Z6DWW4_HYDTE|nr:Nif3-like dinuclear metal center hexameric protein [Hydrogenophilus thermoluteolus]BBD76951.1 metal-binding protein [Hydrogenophilus thermoluteolus]
MHLWELTATLDEWLAPHLFRDYCPNGLQVEGRSEVRRIMTAVTANRTTIEAAVAAEVDLLLVHHGLFWKGDDPCVVGLKRRRLRLLLTAEISLVAYHLPLDAHPEVGNNAVWAQAMGWVTLERFGDQSLGCLGEWGNETDRDCPPTVAVLANRLQATLGHTPLVVGDPDRPVRRLAWCSGAAQSFFLEAVAKRVDAFVTGEISEPYVHLARESGVAFLAAGHHATERFGVQALGARLAQRYGITVTFFDDPSPV